MAKKKRQAEGPKGAAPWMATFSDLMNLLLCFFVLLFSMSTVNEEKFQMVIASLQSSMSIFQNGSLSIGDGDLVGAGIRQLEFLDSYYNELANSKDNEDGGLEGDLKDQLTQAGLQESEGMAEDIQGAVDELGISNAVEITFDSQYVTLNLSGGILFASGRAEILPDAEAIIDKISIVLEKYNKNIIEVEGHTDNVPMTSGRYENNNVLSMYRALSVADYLREHADLDPANIKSSGRGEYVPIASNDTAEGRARNRRVEIKIYNSYASNIEE
ncbi:MAG: chemotaxis protein [Lachnospiraceae bacterium]|nr:chemotaxis protein [Lachnospiraceae bacterium]